VNANRSCTIVCWEPQRGCIGHSVGDLKSGSCKHLRSGEAFLASGRNDLRELLTGVMCSEHCVRSTIEAAFGSS